MSNDSYVWLSFKFKFKFCSGIAKVCFVFNICQVSLSKHCKELWHYAKWTGGKNSVNDVGNLFSFSAWIEHDENNARYASINTVK